MTYIQHLRSAADRRFYSAAALLPTGKKLNPSTGEGFYYEPAEQSVEIVEGLGGTYHGLVRALTTYGETTRFIGGRVRDPARSDVQVPRPVPGDRARPIKVTRRARASSRTRTWRTGCTSEVTSQTRRPVRERGPRRLSVNNKEERWT
jgi:hypothetical protein